MLHTILLIFMSVVLVLMFIGIIIALVKLTNSKQEISTVGEFSIITKDNVIYYCDGNTTQAFIIIDDGSIDLTHFKF